MPRCYFHTLDGTQGIDRPGHELADDAAARREAVRYAGGLLADDPAIVVGGELSCSIIILAVDTNWKSAEADSG